MKKCMISIPNVIGMMTGVSYFIISKRKVTAVYRDMTQESRTGSHKFKIYQDGETADDFNAFSCIGWIQDGRKNV